MPQTNQYQPTAWGSSDQAAGGLEDLKMPSGQLAQVRRPGVENLIQEGVINDIDSLTQLVEGDVLPAGFGKVRKQKADANVLKKLSENPDALTNLLHVVDRVVIHTVVQPKVEMKPNDVTRREDGVIYTDMIDLNDKLFLFAFAVGGTKDWEKFRSESEELVGDMDAVAEAPSSTKRAPSRKR